MEDKAVFSYEVKYIDDSEYKMRSAAGFFYAADFEEAIKYLKDYYGPHLDKVTIEWESEDFFPIEFNSIEEVKKFLKEGLAT